jgi:hypothetical protein
MASLGIRATTNRVRIGDPVRRTQIRRQSESNFWSAPSLKVVGASSNPSFPPRSRHKVSANQGVAESRAHVASFVPEAVRRQVMGAKAFRPSAAHCADPGRGRRKRAQREPESATRRADRFAARKAIPIRPAATPPSGYGRQSVPSSGGSLPRSETSAKEAGTKGAGISDAARGAIRGAKGNPNSPRYGSAVRS